MNGFTSDYYPTEFEIPQGSLLGPLFFLAYINDLKQAFKPAIKFLAVDIVISSVFRNQLISAADLNYYLNVRSDYAHQWKMAFNSYPDKQTVKVLFSQNSILPHSLRW